MARPDTKCDQSLCKLKHTEIVKLNDNNLESLRVKISFVLVQHFSLLTSLGFNRHRVNKHKVLK